MILYMYIAPGQGQTGPREQSFNVNRNVLSLHLFVACLKKMSLKSDFIQIPGDKILMSTERPYHFAHLLQVSKKSL